MKLVNFMKENACLNALIFCLFLFWSFFYKKRMHLWMHKTWFFSFIIFEKCIYECM